MHAEPSPRSRPRPPLSQSELEPFGLRIEAAGVDIGDFPVAQLQRLTREHRFLVLRGFDTFASKAQMVTYCRTWGELLEWNFGFVLDLAAHDEPKNYLFTRGNVPFHWDGAFADQVPHFMLFQCLQAPEPGSGGETLLCDTTRVWRRASREQRERWRDTSIVYRTDKVEHYGGQLEQPLVSCHPITGDTTLRYAEPLNADSVPLNPLHLDSDTLSSRELAALVDELAAALYHPAACVAHEWRAGDIVVVDNHALLHGRNPYHTAGGRHLQRIHVL